MFDEEKRHAGVMRMTICTAVRNAIGGLGVDSLQRCVRSVAALPFEHEHLVYDGASCDGTAEFVRTLARDIPTLKVVSEPDGGIYDALNKGVRDAAGKWFCVLGADDWILDASAMKDCLDCADSEDDDLFISPVEYGDSPIWPMDRRDVYDLLEGMPYSHQGVFVRTDLLREFGGYDRGYRIAADYKFHLQAHLCGVKTGCAWRVFAHVGAAGLSGTHNRSLKDEGGRIRCEVFGLSPAAAERHLRAGTLAPSKWLKLLFSPAHFSRCVGWTFARRWFWHKHKSEAFSTRYLMGVPILRHRLKRRSV